MKKILFIVPLFVVTHVLVVTPVLAQNGGPRPADDVILHIWETQEKDGKMQILKAGSNYYGKMLYGKDLLEADGKTYKRDIHNPDPALRSRYLKDYTIITGLTYKEGKWVNGKIYDFENGNSYDVDLDIKNGTMYMRVYKGIPAFGKTLKWSLVQ
jgi:uncharacterized protein (DUF2147 family)